MNIGINTRFLLSHKPLEGLGRYTYELVSRIVRTYPEHKYIFFFDRKYDDSFVLADNVVPVVVPPMARHPILFYIWFEISLPKFLKQYEIDVFFSPDNFTSLKTNIPTVLTLHDLTYMAMPETIPFIARKYYQYYMPKFLKKADVILPVSNHVKEELYKHYPLLDSEVRVLYNALPSNYEKLNSEVDDNKSMMEDYFIVVGSINKRKNTLKVLQAFNDFIKKSSKPFKIVFAGSRMGEQSNELIRIWEKLVKEERLIHLQNLNDREMISYIKGARALIFASLYEGFGFPILEAYACGIPLITSNVSSMPEVAGKGALFVQPNEVNSISSAMFQIHEDEGLRKRLIAEGKNQIQKFNWEKSVEGLHDSLMWAAGQRNKIK